MKNNISSLRNSYHFRPNFYKKSSFTLLLILLTFYAHAVTLTISGPSAVCPQTTVTYQASTKQFGSEISNCTISWRVFKNGVSVHYVALGGKTFSYYFPDPANYRIECYAITCGIYGDATPAALNITSRVKMPNPIVGTSQVCTPGQTLSYSTSPPLDQTSDPGCNYHYDYLWTAPSGWPINGGTNTYFGGPTVNITIPAGIALGNYTIQVQSSIAYGYPYQSNSWYSTPRIYTIKVGPNSAPTVSVPSQMCPNSSYTFTASGGTNYEWIVNGNLSISYGQGTSSLFVNTYSNYSGGNVQVRTNNGCGGWTAYTSMTLPYPYGCNGTYALEDAAAIKVYPIPATTELSVEWPDSIKVTSIELTDKNSKLLKKMEPKNNKAKLDVSKLKQDEYYLHIFSDKGIIRKRILIKR